MLIIQVAAAALLLLGSGLIFRALLEIEAPTRPRAIVRRHPRSAVPEARVQLPKAA